MAIPGAVGEAQTEAWCPSRVREAPRRRRSFWLTQAAVECQGGVLVDDRRPPQPIGCRVGCREIRPGLRPSTETSTAATLCPGVCRASTAIQQPLCLYSYTAAVMPLQLYSYTALYTLQPLHPPSAPSLIVDPTRRRTHAPSAPHASRPPRRRPPGVPIRLGPRAPMSPRRPVCAVVFIIRYATWLLLR